MFTWLQNNLQKHFRVLFIVLLVVIIVAFVFTIGNQGPIGGGGDERLAKLHFFETPLNSERMRQRFNEDANLSALLSGNMRPSQLLPFERATALHIANLHKVPAPNDSELEAFLKSRPIFQGPDGAFDPQAYNMIVDNIKLGGRATETDLRRVLEDDYRIEKVTSVLEGEGFVQESEILAALSQRLAKWSVLVAKADLASYNPQIEITEEQLLDHYERFDFTYQTPVRRSVKYVEIDAGKFIDQVKPSEDELIAYFEDNIERYQPQAPTPAAGEEAAPAPEPVTYEQARPAVRADYRLEAARDLAQEHAHDLVIDIINNDLSLDSEGFKVALAEHDLTLKTTSHFAANETPIGVNWGPRVVEEAFALTPDRFYSEPLTIGERSVVLFYNDQIDSIVPKFETIRERVATDVREEALRKARAERAVALQDTLEAAATSEESFGAVAEEAGLDVQAYSDFTLTEPAEGLDRRLLSPLLDLESGEVSDLIPLNGENQGAYIYVMSKVVPEVDSSDEQYAQISSSLKSAYARFSAQQYIQELMDAERIRVGLAPELAE